MTSSTTTKGPDETRYYDYIRVGELTNLQVPKTDAHHEKFFIIIHQVYELWFKAILTELDSVMEKFKEGEKRDKKTGAPIGIPEKEVAEMASRLNRIAEIFKLLVAQVRLMETLTPLDFLDFRDRLLPASGYHSLQFRIMEVKLGLKLHMGRTEEFREHKFPDEDEDKYVGNSFAEEQLRNLRAANQSKSLFDHVNSWLRRTPFIQKNLQGIWLENAIQKRINTPTKMPRKGTSDYDAIIMMRDIFKTGVYKNFLNDVALEIGLETRKGLSHPAFLAALFIHLYRDEPILQQPHRLLESLKEIDELFCVWRDWHSSMVMRMIGKKPGTAAYQPGAKGVQKQVDPNQKNVKIYGYKYLSGTRAYRLFPELDRVSTYMIPRTYLDPIPKPVRWEMERLLFQAKSQPKRRRWAT